VQDKKYRAHPSPKPITTVQKFGFENHSPLDPNGRFPFGDGFWSYIEPQYFFVFSATTRSGAAMALQNGLFLTRRDRSETGAWIKKWFKMPGGASNFLQVLFLLYYK
jgi:hypothetical protein